MALLIWLLALPASANVQLQPIKLVPGRPGELLLDASGPNKLLEPPSEVRTFSNEAAYFQFMHDELNAALTVDANGKPIGYELSVTTIGLAVRYDAELRQLIDVPNAFDWWLAGRFGYVVIGGSQHCMNAHLCDRDNVTIRNTQFLVYPDLVVDGTIVPRTAVDDAGIITYRKSFRTSLVSPSLDELLGRWADPCEACEEYAGTPHCRTIECSGQAIALALSVTYEGFLASGKPHQGPLKVGYNEALVEHSHITEYPRGEMADPLICAQSEHTGKALWYNPSIDYADADCAP